MYISLLCCMNVGQSIGPLSQYSIANKSCLAIVADALSGNTRTKLALFGMPNPENYYFSPLAVA